MSTSARRSRSDALGGEMIVTEQMYLPLDPLAAIGGGSGSLTNSRPQSAHGEPTSPGARREDGRSRGCRLPSTEDDGAQTVQANGTLGTRFGGPLVSRIAPERALGRCEKSPIMNAWRHGTDCCRWASVSARTQVRAHQAHDDWVHESTVV
jgi:hypothetical protein